MTVEDERIAALNTRGERPGRYVLYWMQQAQRAADNPALEYAIAEANRLGLPVLVGFGLTDAYPEANARHYAFMLDGLAEVSAALAGRRIGFTLRRGAPDQVALSLAPDAALVVCDQGYLRHQRAWRATVAHGAPCRVVGVETDVVVPVRTASPKHEWAARTFRPRVSAHIDTFLVAHRATRVRHDGRHLGDRTPWPTLASLRVDTSVAPVTRCGGAAAAGRRLRRFVSQRLAGYASRRRDLAAASGLSPYLHFGQISPVRVALAARTGARVDRAAFLEQLIVRRELAINHVYYEPRYDRFDCLPDWARATLAAHARDRRTPIYDRAELDGAATHDPAWNAAMREMRETGAMHNSMRMYWGKKILEWSPSPEDAFDTALALNNRYFLDGRDPASYMNVGWLFGLHDRPWAERPIYGTVRAMTADGLRRKFDIDAYVRRYPTAPE